MLIYFSSHTMLEACIIDTKKKPRSFFNFYFSQFILTFNSKGLTFNSNGIIFLKIQDTSL